MQQQLCQMLKGFWAVEHRLTFKRMPCTSLAWWAACSFSSASSPGAYVMPHSIHVWQ